MKSYQIKFTDKESFENRLRLVKDGCAGLAACSILFYINWTDEARDSLADVTACIEKHFPDSVYYGNEASGNIVNGNLEYGIAVTCYAFESKDAATKLVWVEEGTQYGSLDDLWKYCRDEKGLRAIELIPSISYLDTLKIDNSIPDIPDGVLMFGGASVNYDNPTFEADVIAKGCGVKRDGMAAVLYYGEDVNFASTYVLGWKGLGRHMHVTKSAGKDISEIDGMPAFSIYEKYLNMSETDNDNLVFPLIVKEDGVEYIRTPQLFLSDKSMRMFANIAEGSDVRMAYGDPNTILNTLLDRASAISDYNPQALKAYSCAARRLFWGDANVHKETLPLQDIAPISGFYTGGEILRFGKKLRVLNSTLVIIGMREGGKGPKAERKLSLEKADSSLVSRMTHFVKKITEEQEEALRIAREEAVRNDLLHDIIHSGKWSFEISADDTVLSADYSDNVVQLINNDLVSGDPYAWTWILHPDDKAAALEAFHAAIKDHTCSTPYDVTYRMADRNGEYRWFHSAGRMIRRADGTGEFFGMHVDVTEQVEEQQEQRKLLYFRDFGDMVNAAMWTLEIDANEELKNIYWSDELRHMLGYDDEEEYPNVFESWTDALHPEDREKVINFCWECIRNRNRSRDYNVQYRVVKKDGSYGWYQSAGVVQWNPDGSKTFYGIVKDISAEKKLEEQFALTDGLAREYHTVWLVEGYGEHKLHLFRSTGQKTVKRAVQRGLDEPTYDGTMVKYVMDSVHEDDRERVLEASRFETVMRETPEVGTYAVSYKRYCDDEGNTDFHQMCFARAVAEDGTVNYILAFRDADKLIRDQIAQQEQLAQALSMAESANRAKTTFLNNMSHDIRTPMNAIIGYTGLAASHIDNREQVQDYLSKISQSSDHLLSLINDVLDMSRIESGKMNIEEKEENLSDVIHILRDIVQADVHAKQMDFFVDAIDVNDEDVICDKLRLNQVLLNILSNAIKYTPAGGTIAMSVREKAIKPNGYATYEFVIKDNGIGMSKEFLDTVFDPFTRMKSSTVSGIQGTGLGMAITKNIVDMMGGEIKIKSQPGKGTEVTVVFDFRLQSAPHEPEKIVELKGLRGLVVDDDSMSCRSVSRMLKEIGMRPEWCTSGKEAVIRAEDAYHDGESFTVYIIDWLMPGLDGVETTRRIRRVIGDDAPIIILTSYDWSDIEEEAKQAGVTAFVSKPLFPSDLHRVLNNCLGKEKLPEEAADEADYDFAGKKILLVEDNELNREIATELLGEYGFVMDTAEDGTVAVEKMRNASAGQYDIVLMDIQMPVMDGYEATKQIRALGTEISKIPILAMTANAFEEDRKAALEAGMNEHIAKPIDMSRLKVTLAKFLG